MCTKGESSFHIPIKLRGKKMSFLSKQSLEQNMIFPFFFSSRWDKATNTNKIKCQADTWKPLCSWKLAFKHQQVQRWTSLLLGQTSLHLGQCHEHFLNTKCSIPRTRSRCHSSRCCGRDAGRLVFISLKTRLTQQLNSLRGRLQQQR